MPVTMKEIDDLRTVLDAHRTALHKLEDEADGFCPCFQVASALGDDLSRAYAAVEIAEAGVNAALFEWWAQGCREVG